MPLFFPFYAVRNAISDAPSLRTEGTQSMKWLTEYFDAPAMIVSFLDRRRKIAVLPPVESKLRHDQSWISLI